MSNATGSNTLRLLFLASGYAIAIIICSFVAVFYHLSVPMFLDHIEASMTALTVHLVHGGELYTDINSANRYSLVYGPAPYLLGAPFLAAINDYILAPKLAGALRYLAIMGMLYWGIRRHLPDRVTLPLLGYAVLLFLQTGNMHFSARADSVVIFGVTLAYFGLLLRKDRLTVLLISAGIAITVNTKIHGVLYFLPLAFILISDKNIRPLIYISMVTILMIIVPYFSPQIDLYNHLRWLAMASHHDMELELFFQNIIIGLVSSIPFLVIAVNGFTSGARQDRRYFCIKTVIVTMFAVLAVSIVASKEGAGPPHLLPFGPVYVILLAILIGRENAPIKIGKKIGYGLTLWTLLISLSALAAQVKTIRDLSASNARAINTELRLIAREYRGLKKAFGFSEWSRRTGALTNARPVLYEREFAGLYLDITAMLDMNESGLAIPDATYDRLSNKEYDIFVIPKPGDPFTVHAGYQVASDIFGDRFRSVFHHNYKKVGERQYYEVWQAIKD